MGNNSKYLFFQFVLTCPCFNKTPHANTSSPTSVALSIAACDGATTTTRVAAAAVVAGSVVVAVVVVTTVERPSSSSSSSLSFQLFVWAELAINVN